MISIKFLPIISMYYHTQVMRINKMITKVSNVSAMKCMETSKENLYNNARAAPGIVVQILLTGLEGLKYFKVQNISLA